MLLLVLSWVPVLIGRDAVPAAAALFPLATSAHPYFVPDHVLLLYVWSPLVVASAICLLLSPGLLLALALGAAESIGHWIVSALALSLVVVSAAAAVVQGLQHASLRGTGFALVTVGCAAVCFSVLLVRLMRRQPSRWPWEQPHAAATLVMMLVAPSLLLIGLTPKFYWENFNGDGAHAFESARLLLVQPIPLWPGAAGSLAAFPGLTSMLFIFPTAWFIRLFGEVEVSARLPFLVYLIGLDAVLLALIERERRTVLGLPERLLLWLQIMVYAIVLAFSATYSPYSADLALPATQDTLAIVCFLGFGLAFLHSHHGWAALFLMLTFLALPNGSLLVGMWLLAVFLLWRPPPWRAVALTAAASCGYVLGAALLPHVLTAFHLPASGNEYAMAGLVKRFAFLQWADWRRVAFVVVPSGILPAAALFAWRAQDRLARTLTLVTVMYFGFFYVLAHTALHYFIPALIFPLVVFWRSQWTTGAARRPFVLFGTAIAGAVALWVSLPIHADPHTTARLIGSTIEDRMDGYDRSDPTAFRRAELLRRLFPPPWDRRVPSETYGGSALAWNYYAHRAGDGRDINYLLQPVTQAMPDGMHLLAEDNGVALYVRSDDVWTSHLAVRPLTPAGSGIYAIPQDVLFGFDRPTSVSGVIDVQQVMERLGIDADGLLRRLGIQR